MPKPVFRIEARLGVPAPQLMVWEALADLEAWSDWNPFYPRVEGQLRIGAPLLLTEAPAGHEPAVVRAAVVDWAPEMQILWRATERYGMIQRLHFLEIDKLTDEACIISNGEDWFGRLAPFVGRPRRRAIRAGLEAMNQALSERAVALWRNGAGAPTSDGR